MGSERFNEHTKENLAGSLRQQWLESLQITDFIFVADHAGSAITEYARAINVLLIRQKINVLVKNEDKT